MAVAIAAGPAGASYRNGNTSKYYRCEKFDDRTRTFLGRCDKGVPGAGGRNGIHEKTSSQPRERRVASVASLDVESVLAETRLDVG